MVDKCDECLLSVVILTLNEELHLERALESLRPLCAEVYVVDSGSEDRTIDIARSRGCHVATHEFVNHAEQLNWALETLPLRGAWVMRLDADEFLTPELAQELVDELPKIPRRVSGLLVKRRIYFWGRWIRHGGVYPVWMLRVWRRGDAECETRWMDEHMILRRGEAAKLRNDFVDANLRGLSYWVDKHNWYATREVGDLLSPPGAAADSRLSGQAGWKRSLKTGVYGRAPRFFRAWAYWFQRYFLRLGFLDGVEGFVFHFMQALWYRMLVDAKMEERRRVGEEVVQPRALRASTDI